MASIHHPFWMSTKKEERMRVGIRKKTCSPPECRFFQPEDGRVQVLGLGGWVGGVEGKTFHFQENPFRSWIQSWKGVGGPTSIVNDWLKRLDVLWSTFTKLPVPVINATFFFWHIFSDLFPESTTHCVHVLYLVESKFANFSGSLHSGLLITLFQSV